MKRIDEMDAWCKQHHGASGLIDACQYSTISIADAERQVLAYVRKYCKQKEAILAPGL